MKDLWNQAWEDRERLVMLRRALHRQPELALQERHTAARIEAELDRLGVAHTRVGETGVLGVLRGAGEVGRTIALRADIDALPIQEENDADYRSETDGVMHACGHDAHTTCLLGAAKLLASRRENFSGEIRFFFQPAEETGGGAPEFIRAGALEGAQRVFGLHVAPEFPVGTVGVKPGLNNAAVDLFQIRVRGKAAHVSVPDQGADALYAASQIVVAIQGLAARRISPVEPVILGVGKLRAGTTYNAVAEYAELEGTTRTISEQTRRRVRGWIDEAAQSVGALSGARAEILWTEICSALFNDPDVSAEVIRAAEAVGLRVVSDRPLSLGGDNFAEYLLQTPGCYAYLGSSDPARPGTQIGLHNGHFDLDEDVLVWGAALYAGYALRFLGAEETP